MSVDLISRNRHILAAAQEARSRHRTIQRFFQDNVATGTAERMNSQRLRKEGLHIRLRVAEAILYRTRPTNNRDAPTERSNIISIGRAWANRGAAARAGGLKMQFIDDLESVWPGQAAEQAQQYQFLCGVYELAVAHYLRGSGDLGALEDIIEITAQHLCNGLQMSVVRPLAASGKQLKDVGLADAGSLGQLEVRHPGGAHASHNFSADRDPGDGVLRHPVPPPG
jgi:hypothetical protein